MCIGVQILLYMYTRPAVCTQPIFCSNFVLIYQQRSLFKFVNFSKEAGSGEGLAPSPDYRNKLMSVPTQHPIFSPSPDKR